MKKTTQPTCGVVWINSYPVKCQMEPGHPMQHQYKDKVVHIIWYNALNEKSLDIERKEEHSNAVPTKT